MGLRIWRGHENEDSSSELPCYTSDSTNGNVLICRRTTCAAVLYGQCYWALCIGEPSAPKPRSMQRLLVADGAGETHLPLFDMTPTTLMAVQR